MHELILIGAGSVAKAVIAAADQAGMRVRALYDDDSSRWGTTLLKVPVVGALSEAAKAGLPAVLGLDDPIQRKAAVDRLNLQWATVVHPSAFINPSCAIGAGTVILEGAIVQPNVTLGRHVIIEANATVSHDCVVEDFAYLGPGVDLAGSVRVGEGASFQVGAIVTPNICVGAWAMIGPRSAVIRDVPDHVTVDGLPARPS
ncbi:MAG TPA: NeuD/PglB/VioB family sugar acetyltransferase [Pirellulales bacterium]|nr:NeuD/PglB/VioB family sugar acetyltransferase [Pirellulales bacterium]